MKALFHNPIVKRFSALAGGSVIGQSFMFAALPLAAALYSPADFGVLGTFSALVMLALPAACLRFDLAIAVPLDDNEARALMLLGFVSSSFISLLCWPLLSIFTQSLGHDFVTLFDRFGWLVPLTLWAASLFSLAQYWAVRRNQFRKLALSHASRGLLGASTQVGLGFAGVGSLGLILGQAFYMGLGAVALLSGVVRKELPALKKLSPGYLRHTALKHWRFPVFSTPEALLDAAGMHLPLLMIASLSGAEAAGLLFFAQRLTQIPVALVGGNLSRVFVAEAPRQLEKNNLWAFTFRLWIILLLIGLGPIILCFLILFFFNDALFGAEWRPAADIIIILLPAVYLQFCVIPISTALHVRAKQATALALQSFGLIAQVGSIAVCHITGLVDPVTAFAIGTTIYYIIYTTTVLWTVNKSN